MIAGDVFASARRAGTVAVFLLGLALASCGGGGGDDTAATAAAPAASAAGDGRNLAAAFPVAAAPDGRKFAAAVPFTDQSSGNGWYWNPLEGGTGFMFEAQGNRAFVAFFMYAEGTGLPIWYAAYGDFLPTGSTGGYAFTGDLRVYQGGQAVTSAAYTGPTSVSIGSVSIAFASGRAVVTLPGGRI